MNKLFVIVLFLTGCSSGNFYYNQEVTITSGIFKNCSGKIINSYQKVFGGTRYMVHINKCPGIEYMYKLEFFNTGELKTNE